MQSSENRTRPLIACVLTRPVCIPCSHDNPEFLWIDDSEVVRDFITICGPVPGHVVAQEVQHCDAELLERGVAFVVCGVSVHQPPQSFDRVEMWRVGWNEVELDSAAGPCQPTFGQFHTRFS